MRWRPGQSTPQGPDSIRKEHASGAQALSAAAENNDPNCIVVSSTGSNDRRSSKGRAKSASQQTAKTGIASHLRSSQNAETSKQDDDDVYSVPTSRRSETYESLSIYKPAKTGIGTQRRPSSKDETRKQNDLPGYVHSDVVDLQSHHHKESSGKMGNSASKGAQSSAVGTSKKRRQSEIQSDQTPSAKRPATSSRETPDIVSKPGANRDGLPNEEPQSASKSGARAGPSASQAYSTARFHVNPTSDRFPLNRSGRSPASSTSVQDAQSSSFVKQSFTHDPGLSNVPTKQGTSSRVSSSSPRIQGGEDHVDPMSPPASRHGSAEGISPTALQTRRPSWEPQPADMKHKSEPNPVPEEAPYSRGEPYKDEELGELILKMKSKQSSNVADLQTEVGSARDCLEQLDPEQTRTEWLDVLKREIILLENKLKGAKTGWKVRIDQLGEEQARTEKIHAAQRARDKEELDHANAEKEKAVEALRARDKGDTGHGDSEDGGTLQVMNKKWLELNGNLQAQVDGLTGEATRLKIENGALRESLASETAWQSKYDALDVQFAQLTRENEAFEKQTKQLTADLIDHKNDAQTLRDQVSDVKGKCTRQETRVKELEAEVRTEREKAGNLQEQLARLQPNVSELSAKVAHLERDISARNARVGQLEQEASSAKAKSVEATREASQLKGQLIMAKQDSDRKDTIIKQLRPEASAVPDLRQQIQRLKDQLEAETIKVKEKSDRIAGLERALVDRESAESKKITGLESHLREESQKLAQKEAQLRKAEEAAKSASATANETVKSLEEKLHALSTNFDAQQSARRQSDESKKQVIESRDARIRELEKQAQKDKGTIKTLEDQSELDRKKYEALLKAETGKVSDKDASIARLTASHTNLTRSKRELEDNLNEEIRSSTSKASVIIDLQKEILRLTGLHKKSSQKAKKLEEDFHTAQKDALRDDVDKDKEARDAAALAASVRGAEAREAVARKAAELKKSQISQLKEQLAKEEDGHAKTQGRLDELNAQTTELRRTIADLQQEAADKNAKIDELIGKVTAADTKAIEEDAKINELTQKVANADAEVRGLRNQIVGKDTMIDIEMLTGKVNENESEIKGVRKQAALNVAEVSTANAALKNRITSLEKEASERQGVMKQNDDSTSQVDRFKRQMGVLERDANNHKDQAAQMGQELFGVKGELEKLKSQSTAIQGDNKKLRRKVDDLKLKVEEAETTKLALQGLAKEKDALNTKLQGQIETLQAQVSAAEEAKIELQRQADTKMQHIIVGQGEFLRLQSEVERLQGLVAQKDRALGELERRVEGPKESPSSALSPALPPPMSPMAIFRESLMGEQKEVIRGLAREIEQLREEVAGLQETISNLQKDNEHLRKEADDWEDEARDWNKKYHVLKGDWKGKDKEKDSDPGEQPGAPKSPDEQSAASEGTAQAAKGG